LDAFAVEMQKKEEALKAEQRTEEDSAGEEAAE
jgi:hypothetical protein